MRVFVDSNIPMYVAGAEHPNKGPATRFLERAADREFDLCTSTEVLQEILFRYTVLGRPELADRVYDPLRGAHPGDLRGHAGRHGPGEEDPALHPRPVGA